MEMQVTLWTGH